ncbi:MAG: chromosome segregation protein SMC [Candidatus Neomarinimicrobiota bacterium]
MYISKLSLYGFKSFLKCSEIEFGRGITSIVGPNGCGKTNIVDALRWVIGEQKSSVLRADRNTDVIFNGTSAKRPLNMAEVSLTIHDVTSRAAVELSDVTITRRLYRNGESEYFINKNLCRLKDITDLFIDTGMGANAYSIIELKMIEDILSETPEERKRLFEEAAGVNKYRIQRKAAIRKLEATREDLLRLNDIITEVDSKVKNLKRQLHRYEKYQEVTQSLIESEVALATRRILNIRLKSEPIHENFRAKQETFDRCAGDLTVLERDWRDNQQAIEEKEEVLQQQTDMVNSLRSTRSQLETNDLLLKEQHRNITQTISRLSNEIESHTKNISLAEERKIALKTQQSETGDNLEKKREEFKNLSEAVGAVDQQYKSIDKELQTLQDERYALFRQQAEFAARVSSLKENIRQRGNDLQAVLNRIAEQDKVDERSAGQLEEIRGKISQSNRELDQRKDRLRREDERFQELSDEEQKLRDELRKVDSELDKLSNRISFYSGIIQTKEGFAPGLQFVLDHLSDFPGIQGSLSDLLSVDSTYYLAVETVIKDISRLLVADSQSVALHALEKLSSTGKGRVSVIPLDIEFHNSEKEKFSGDGFQPLSQFIKCGSSLSRLKEFLFGSIYVCDDGDFESLIWEKKYRNLSFITPRGRFRDANGFFAGGSETSESSALVGRNQKLYEFEKKFDALKIDKEGIVSQIGKIGSDLRQVAANRNALKNEIAQFEKILQADEDKRRAAESLLSQSNGIRRNLNESKVSISVALENFNEKLKRENPENDSISTKITSLDAAILEKKENLSTVKSSLDEQNARIQNARIELVNLENSYRNLVAGFEAADRSIANLSNVRNAAIQDKNKNIQSKLEIDLKMETNGAEIKKISERLTKAEQTLVAVQSAHQRLRSDQQDLNDRMTETRRNKENLSEELKKMELAFSEYKAADNEIRSILFEKYNRSVPDEMPESLPEEETLCRDVERFKRNLEMIGMVNMAVKDEYEQENMRYKFLSEQRDDLIASEKGLNEVILQIDNVAREQYIEIFEKIRQNFQSTFSIFFNGGEADVKLIGDPDPLESQIEIWACPSGKKLRSLKMLSAGEKALTAISLLFAIYQVKPSPFCILDEVDAPLDDQNTSRFTNVLKTFSDKTQFIIVTHNKSTMSIADALYGVTMAEKGVSQIISAKLD